MKRATRLALLLCLCACVDEPTPPENPMLEVSEGDPCNWPNVSCVDEDSVKRCIEGYWGVQTCDDICAEFGPGVTSPGCDVEIPVSAPEHVCGCEPPADGCYPGQGQCEDNDTITWCADTWTWSVSSCAAVCEEQSLLSLGCDSIGQAAVCLCTNTGTPCVDTPSVCADASGLSSCVDGVWVLTDCAQSCGGAGSCDPGASDDGAACACGD